MKTISKRSEWPSRLLKAGSLTLRLSGSPESGGGELEVEDASGHRLGGKIPVYFIRPPGFGVASLHKGGSPSHQAMPILWFPGSRRHPSGRSAPISWINDEGRGFIQAVHGGHVLHVILDGAATRFTSNVKVSSSGFLLAAIALALPVNITGRRFEQITRFSTHTVWGWLEAQEKEGWIIPVSIYERSQAYCLSASGIAACGEQVETGWTRWRQSAKLGRSIPAPERRYFLALAEIDEYQSIAGDQPVTYTGIESLVRDGNLMRMGSIKETAFMTTTLGMERISAHFRNMNIRNVRDFAGASEVTVVSKDHPFWKLIKARKMAEFTPAWPLGFGALDAIDHPDPRISETARATWEAWIGTVGSHVSRMQVPRA